MLARGIASQTRGALAGDEHDMSRQPNPGLSGAAGPPAPANASARAELSAALEALQHPPPAPRMPPARLDIRIKTAPLLRRLTPTRPLLARAVRRGVTLWETSPEQRANALATMTAILAGSYRAAEIEQLAREHLIEREVDNVFFWQQPWSADADDRSSALLHDAFSSGRGVLLSACHSGAYYRSLQAQALKGSRHYSVVGSWFLEQPSHDYWGRRIARWRKGVNSHPVLAKGSFPVLAALLARGQSVYLFFDMPGPRETRFLGKTAMLADGTARLAVGADALVVPLRARRRGNRVWTQAAPAFDPREHAGVGELHAALAAHHERWILEEPAMMADPNSFGWDQGARAQGWSRP
jgi:lauroyl/myristoyl acyltransferase